MRLLKCPNCKSTNITLDTGGQTGKYLCKDCGYIGGFVIEEYVGEDVGENVEEKFGKETKRRGVKKMSICTRKYSWNGWQFGVLKLAMIAFGILLGAYFAGFWKKILWLVWVVFILLAVWSLVIWCDSMKKPVKKK